MSEFDDAVVSGALTERAGVGDVGIEGALHAVNRRAIATRRRRAAAAGVGAMTGVVLLATAALATRAPDVVRTPTDSDVPAVSDPVLPTEVAPTTAPRATTTDERSAPSTSIGTTPPTSVGTASPTTSPSEGPPPTTAGGTPASTPSATTAPSSPATVTTAPAATAPAPTSSPPTTSGPPAPSTSEPDDEPDDEPGTPPFSGRVYSSGGGSITVSWNGTALSLGGTSPAAGYTASVEDQRSDRIRVHFTGPDDWRIEVRADGDGVVTSTVSS